jgi:hypothetical protein
MQFKKTKINLFANVCKELVKQLKNQLIFNFSKTIETRLFSTDRSCKFIKCTVNYSTNGGVI